MKRTLSIAIALILCLSLCACAKSDKKPETPTESISQTKEGAPAPTYASIAESTDGTTAAPATEASDFTTAVPATKPTTAPTTKSTSVPTTMPATKATSASTTTPATKATSAPTTKSTSIPTTAPATKHSSTPTTSPTTKPVTKPTPTSETIHAHSWNSATCTAPKTCSTCGAIEGEPLSHNYSAGKCTACGVTDENYRELKDGSWRAFVVSKDTTFAMQYTMNLSKKDTLGSLSAYGLSFTGGRRTDTLSTDELNECPVRFYIDSIEYANNGDYDGVELVDYTANGDIINIDILRLNDSNTDITRHPYLELTRTAANQFTVTKVLDSGTDNIPAGTVFTFCETP